MCEGLLLFRIALICIFFNNEAAAFLIILDVCNYIVVYVETNSFDRSLSSEHKTW